MSILTWIDSCTVLVRSDARAANERFYGVTADAMWRKPRAGGPDAAAPVRAKGRPVLKDVSVIDGD